jgi:hypothetical protein
MLAYGFLAKRNGCVVSPVGGYIGGLASLSNPLSQLSSIFPRNILHNII